ncbi:MAG: extracellular solute-binding protein [Spirochaetaceae bacterium]|jgi:raffinose/stachyose/melibiose transport system substrate-binding protein|nr:extracellular solute-binding protein [Spirochaetaceae bacterium]
MKIVKKVLFLFSLFLVFVAANALCGGGRDAGADSGGKTRLRYYNMWPNNESDTPDPRIVEYNKMYDEFRTANPDIELEIIADAHEAWATKVKTMMTANDLTEVFISQPSDCMVYADSGVYYDFTNDLNADPAWKNSFTAGSLETMSKNGHVYGISHEGYVEGVFYNQAIFDRYGLTYPKTWEELVNCVKTFKANGVVSFAVGAKDGWPVSMTTQFLMDREGGYALFERGCADRSVSMNAPDYVRAFEKFLELVNLGAFSDGVLGASQNDAEDMFMQGRAAMIINGSWMVGDIDAFQGGSFAKNIHFGNFPAVSGGKGVQDALCAGYGKAFCMPAKISGKQREAGLKFIKFMNNPTASKRFLENVGVLFASKPSGIDMNKVSPLMKEVVDLSGSVRQTWMAYGELITPGFYDEMNKIGQQILLKAVSATQAAEMLERARIEFQINF